MTNFLAELRRRNVIRVAGLYLVGAWLVVQVAETVLPIFETPGWVLKAMVVLLALGFVPAVVASWVFELTPDGLRRDAGGGPAAAAGSDAGEVRVDRTARKLDIAVIAMLALVGAMILWQQRTETGPETGSDALSPVPTAGDGPAATGTRAADPAPEATPAGGVGVLPFDNLSPDPDNAFFASGIHEEVLSRLARVDGLRVISRTSMERVAADNLSVPEIGARLGVSHVLEGSVRRAGDQVRITVQLIEAATDRHVWAENYDRALDDVFAIQSEIALAIADKLQVALSAGEKRDLADRPTTDSEAYDLYLRAVAQDRVWRGGDGFRAQIALLEPAVARDPDFAEARRMLAEAYGRMGWLGIDPDGAYRAKAIEQVETLVRRWPGSFEARRAQAMLDYTVRRDYAAALEKLRALATERPNDVDIAIAVSSSLKRLERYDEQLVAIRRALALDPESSVVNTEMVLALGNNGLYDEAVALADAEARRHRDDPAVQITSAAARLQFGGDRAPLLATTGGEQYQRVRAQAFFSEGQVDRAVEELGRGLEGLTDFAAARIQAEKAALLRLAGRDDEAAPYARAAFEGAKAWVDAGRPDPIGMRRVDQASAAVIATIAGRDADAAAWTAIAEAEPPESPEQVVWWSEELAEAARWRGDVDAAWARLAPRAGGPGLTDPEIRALRPWYDAMYGEAAAYREYTAKLGGARTEN